MLALLSREPASGGAAPALDAGRCVRGRFTRASCRRCADACPRGAIELGRGPPLVRSGGCTGCRTCQRGCPTGALGDPAELDRAIAEIGERPHPVLGCRVPGVEAHGRVACLGMLDDEALLALAARFPGGITLNLVHCGTCPNAAVAPALRRSLAGVAAWTGSLAGRVRAVESRAALRFERDALSRRQFFSMLSGRPRDSAGATPPRTNAPEPPSAKRLPTGRSGLLRVLEVLPQRVRAETEARCFPSLSFSPECRGCTGCVGVCPTGALAVGDGERPRPEFEPSACTGCGVCAEFCRRGAIRLSARTTAVACG